MKTSPSERFWDKVDASGDCWLWLSSGVPSGYGTFWTGERRTYAHRYAWESLVGPIPTGMTIDHLCFVKNCVNPDHLRLLTQGDNARAGSHRHANSGLTKCKRGHMFDVANTYVQPGRSGRTCKTCVRERQRKAYRASVGLEDR